MRRNAKTPSIQAQIKTMVKRIVDRFHPEQIILFGSRARGDARPDSDVDLLVVMDVDGSRDDKRQAIRRALTGIPVWVDIIITSPEDFAWRKDIVGTIEWPATHEGKVLYARTGSGGRRPGRRSGGRRGNGVAPRVVVARPY